VSVTSAGRIVPLDSPPYFVLITEALRDEGTSHHYLPPTEWVSLDPLLAEALDGAFDGLTEPVRRGRSWTTDAPYRETETAIEAARRRGIHAVEMEAAALYAYAEACSRDVVCIAHVTNDMAVDGDDFEKGIDAGTHRILAVVTAIADRLRPVADDESDPIAEHGAAERGADNHAVGGLAEHWDRAYSEHGDDVSWYQDVPTISLGLIEGLGVAAGDPVIDVGGGRSHLVDELAARGHTDLTVLDVSEAALESVRKRSGDGADIQLINADVLTWKPRRRYRLWHDRAVLHFITNDADRERYRKLLDNALTSDGVVVIAVFDSDGPEQCSGLPVRRYSPRELVDFLGPDFEPVVQKRDVHVTPWDTEQSFTWIAARRR
ncbi:MAG: methyltransferase domain-containing protein, partial [Microthrixaceae bacterium]|nr:methyltransferase domain-containing protein [Microthrixaceae bacterium]